MTNYIGPYEMWFCAQQGRIVYQSYLTTFRNVCKMSKRIFNHVLSKDPTTVLAIRNPRVLAKFHCEC